MVILRNVSFLVLLASATILSGCIPVAVTAGAAAGIAAGKDGGIGGELEDAKIGAAINDAWFKKSTSMFAKLHLTVEQGNVLITGVVQNPEDRVEAVRLAWAVEGVKKVINEIQIADDEGASGYLKDKWIGTQLRAKLTVNRDVSALNYSIEVVRGVVYLMGVARSQSELNEVVDVARNINYVQNVVSYVRVQVEQAPVINSANTTNYTANSDTGGSSTITSYPAASGGMQPIVDDPYGNNGASGGSSGASGANGVVKQDLPPQ